MPKQPPPVRILVDVDARGYWARVRVAGLLVHLSSHYRSPGEAARAAQAWVAGAGPVRGARRCVKGKEP
jgi:hypothetical protein